MRSKGFKLAKRGYKGSFANKEWSEPEVRLVENAILNGRTVQECFADFFGISDNTTVQRNLVRNPEISERFRLARQKAVSESISNLRRLADGMTLLEREYLIPIDERVEAAIEQNAARLSEALRHRKISEFFTVLLNAMPLFEKYLVKVRQKEVAPDFRAIQLMLQAQANETWDIEAKNKKIPNTKIIVTLNGGNATQKNKEIPADYVREA